jgi:hypothetical protein
LCESTEKLFPHCRGGTFVLSPDSGRFHLRSPALDIPRSNDKEKGFFAPEQMKFVEKLKSHESSLLILEEERQQDSSSCSLSRKPDRRQKIYLNEIMKTLIVSDGDE